MTGPIERPSLVETTCDESQEEQMSTPDTLL
jgi:hypothetical protein